MLNLTIKIAMMAGLTFLFVSSPLHAQNQTAQDNVTTPEAMDETTITGKFELIDHIGKLTRDKDFRGQYLLVFLGYTYCPDVCPTDLQSMADTLDLMGDKADRIQPIFITVDPERDTPPVLAEFVSNFHPRLIGLTGTPKQARDAAQAFGAKYHKVFASPNSEENQDGDEFYLINHSAATYLIGPDGDYLGYFAHGSHAQGMAEELLQVIK